MGDELVGEGVGLGRHAHGHVVATGIQGRRQQIGDRLADARSRLDRAVRRGRLRATDLLRHLELLGARLVGVIHPAHDAFGTELSGNLVRGDADELDVLLGRVDVGVVVGGLHQVTANRRHVQRYVGHVQGQVVQDRAVLPLYVVMHRGKPAEKTGGQRGQTAQHDAPHAT